MIRVHMLVFLTVLELGVVFAALWLAWFFKSRTLARQLAAVRAPQTKPQSATNAAAYFATELLVTQAQLDGQDGADTAPRALVLRAAYLELEREFSQSQERDPAFWAEALTRLDALLAEQIPSAPVAVSNGLEQVPVETDEEETVRVKRLFDAQVSTINELKEALATLTGGSEEGAEMLAQIDKLGRTNREMSMCVSILEDDNIFLREQISTLVHMDAT